MLPLFAGVPGKLKAIADSLALNLDVTASSRAPADTALSVTAFTNGRAAKLDSLNAGSVIKSVQRGTVLLVTTLVTVAINEVNPGKTMVFSSQSSGYRTSDYDSAAFAIPASVYLLDSTNIRVQRGFTNLLHASPTVYWQVVEFY